jgi:anti-sigma B factor antagonist
VNDLSFVEVFARAGVPIVRVRGEIDLSNAESVLTLIDGARDDDAPGLVVDLHALEYLDSAGVRLLFRASRSVGESGGRFVAVVPRDSPVRRVLDLAEASTAFPLEESEEAALERVTA